MQIANSPFIFGRKAVGDNFTDRKGETERLISNFRNKVNTILISPRRLGKSSLVKKAGDQSISSTLIVIHLDAFGIRDANEFYKVLATEVIRSTSGTIETWIENAKRFFSRITPRFSFGSDPVNSFELSFDLDSIEKNYQEILDLPEKIASEKDIKLVICIDEFQNTALFSDSVLFHKRLRTAWQNHQSVTYCIYGSKYHMMSALFEKQSMPFYRFGEIIHLGKIPADDWVKFIAKRFRSTNKTIDLSLAQSIADTVKCHSYYVQLLSHLVWLRTSDEANDEILTIAKDDMIVQNAMLYQYETEALSETQLNFLKAVATGIKANFNSGQVIQQFRLGTSANVSKVKKVLIDKEIIDLSGQGVEFLDPVYELWFIRNILKRK
ncbi:MAG: ATP-binding protein [Bacteroidales bacterium]|nr:ATP-binding protein [Bacteroidales bacterium]